MAKSKSHEHRRNRQKVAIAVAEINQSIEQLRERVTQVDDMRKDGFPYRDALKARAEVQIRDSIRKIFGDKSPEFQEHRHHRIKTYPVTEIGKTLSMLQGLIARLEQKKLDFLGVGQSRPNTVPTQQPSGSTAIPAQPSQVPSPPPPPQAAMIPGTPVVFYPVPPGAVWAPPPIPTPPPVTATPAPPVADPVQPVSSSPPPPPTPAPPPVTAAPAQVAPPPPPPPIAANPGPASATRSTKSSPADRRSSQTRSGQSPVESEKQRADWSCATTSESSPVPDALESVRKICTRFHVVARQLRLRREYRATLEVEDEYDVQDLFYALLRLEFDDVVTEDWMPSYTDSANRTSFLLKREKLAIVVKKTRPGLSAREVADQLTIDSQRYSTHPDCTTLFCFVYDPEGRIGNPRGLEAELTSVSDQHTIEVVVTPK